MAAELFDFYNPNIAPQIDREPSLLSSLDSQPNRPSSNWEVLNRATSALIRRRLAAAGQSAATIQLAQALIASYHRVYRADLMQHRYRGNYGPCPVPTVEQLDRIGQQWQENNADYQKLAAENRVANFSENILTELERLAELLRQEFNPES